MPPAERPLQVGVAARLGRLPWAHRSGPYQALDLTFAVRTCDPALGDHLADLLAPFSISSSAEATMWLSALDRGEGRRRRLVAYLGGRRLVATDTASLVPEYLLWALNREVVATARNALLVHAAAAERDGAVVVLPAPQHAGKTTLVSGLLRRGYGYVTDEVFALDVASGRCRAYPKALGLEPGSWPMFPELALSQAGAVGTRGPVAAALLGPMAAGDAVARVMLSPRYEAGGPTTVTRLRPAEGLVLLVENSFNGASWGQPGLDAAAGLIRGCPVIGTLAVGDLEAACDLVDLAVEEALVAVGSDA